MKSDMRKRPLTINIKQLTKMKIDQIYTGCLAQGAYYIESEGESVIIDPLREVDPYIQLAEERGTTIKYILETHFHADFVSGHVDLSKKTGATIVFGPTANTSYDVHVAKDGEILEVGKLKIKVLHTPGHTMESTTYLLIDSEGKNQAIFSGDTLFIGDVGRPDLAVKSDLTTEDLAGLLYDSLRNKIMPLGDDLVVYPGHGAGSACGKNMSDETSDTLGNQKQTNYALRADMTRDEFVKEVTHGILPPPQYFSKNAMLNKGGYREIDDILEKGLAALNPQTFKEYAESEGALILDTRNRESFRESHIPGSLFIGLDGEFAPWVGALIKNLDQPIIFLTEEGHEEEVVIRLARVGYDNSKGYLKGGIQTWINAGNKVDSLNYLTSKELANMAQENLGGTIIDVRRPTEHQSEKVLSALNIPLDYYEDFLDQLGNKEDKFFLHCVSGYRSVIMASVLKGLGYHNLVDVTDGFNGIKETDMSISEYICPTTL
jgi:glyoxylase-like metal-dependent hydrolase (beta-lactamase superfamily II)/rhodanese-related sulfurtransferase